jgi:hypothetical protein
MMHNNSKYSNEMGERTLRQIIEHGKLLFVDN